MQVPEFVKPHKKLAAIVISLAAAGTLTGMILSKKGNKASFMTGKVGRGNITAIVQSTGTINPITTAPVGSYVSGNVKYIFADFNSHLRAGQVLAQIDPAVYQAQLLTAQGDLASARANMKNFDANLVATRAAVATYEANAQKDKANLEYVTLNAKRNQDLYKQGIVSIDLNQQVQSTLGQAEAAVVADEAQVNQAKAQIEQVEAQIDQAKAQAEAAEGNVRQAETNLRYTTIVSPIDGVVVSRAIDVGQAIASSLQAQTLFSVAQDLRLMQVAAQVDESDTGNIVVGTPCSFQVDAFPNETFHGRVSSIRLNPTVVQNVVTYSVVIDFDNPQEKLLPGETAYVTIPAGHAQDALEVPNSAIIFTPSMPPEQLHALYARYDVPRPAYTNHTEGWQVVWKLTPGGNRVVPVGVRTGLSDFRDTQILQGNLQPGEVVATGQLTGATKPNQRHFGPRF